MEASSLYHRKDHAEAPRLKARDFNQAHGALNIDNFAQEFRNFDE
jgi:hypothetical protein